MPPYLKLAKDLTKLFITWHRCKYATPCIEYLRDALIAAQKQLSPEQKQRYEAWHKKNWPNLDW